ncbi:MAG TPA: hypothetical protein VGR14_21775 [Verrucomicrobiae bacterium]|jgi:hypothetical protein|nr:hypothetical protein [Verrucomicrobiae bacterium]
MENAQFSLRFGHIDRTVSADLKRKVGRMCALTPERREEYLKRVGTYDRHFGWFARKPEY